MSTAMFFMLWFGAVAALMAWAMWPRKPRCPQSSRRKPSKLQPGVSYCETPSKLQPGVSYREVRHG